MSRRTAREEAFQLIFAIEASKSQSGEALESYFEENEVSDHDRAYIQAVVEGCFAHVTDLDALIQRHAKGWDVGRISRVSLAIMRQALYEMRHCEDIPANVSINEAVELAKNYESPEAGAFVNGILGAVLE